MNRPPVLSSQKSAELLGRLLGQLDGLSGDEGLLAWARATLPLKNTLLEADARLLETRLSEAAGRAPSGELGSSPDQGTTGHGMTGMQAAKLEQSGPAAIQQHEGHLAFPKEPPRKRSKAHLAFISEQP